MKILYFSSTTIKTSLKIFLIALLFSGKSYSSSDYCNFEKAKYLKELNNKKNIIQINIKSNNLKRWSKNNLKILKSDGKIINQKLKKNFKASVEIIYNFGICNYPAKIRQTGDFKDHIKMSKGKIYQSLKIKLVDGNILGNINFKLLIPETRGKDEIIVSKLLKSLDLLSPEIFNVDVNNNGHKSKMLFHQEADKEFIEQNSKTESALFEGDESLIWNFEDAKKSNYNYLEEFSLARMINAKWTEKNINSKLISSKAYSRIQKVYLNKINKESIYYFDLDLLSNSKKKYIEKWITFEMIMLSSNCSHGLSGINRKFYWDSLQEAFLPIFYDGNCNIDNKYLKRLIKSNFLNLADKEYYKKIFTKKNLENIQKKLLNIDTKKFNRYFVKKDQLNLRKIEKKIDTINKNLIELEKYFVNSKDNKLKDNKNIKNFEITKLEKVFSKKLPNYFFLTLNERDISTSKESKFLICKKNKCEDRNLSIKKIFSTTENKGEIKYLFNNFTGIKENIIEEDLYFNGRKIKLKRTKGIDINYDNKNIFIKQKYIKDWIVLFESDLQNINIKYTGLIKKNEKHTGRFNKNGLTGCLNFIKINFKNNVNINYENSNCEDSVNIRNSKGKIDNLIIKNSFSDALDIDFSNISIDNVIINKADNDCVDFSFGKYKIKNTYLYNCKDKSVSLGERSALEIENANVFNSNIALVSKDSSILNVKVFNHKNVNICASAYNKKQEFDGAIIFLKDNKCKIENINNDDSSKIIF